MARLLSKIASKVSNFLRRKPSLPPKVNARVIGHRGVAAGSVAKRAAAGGVGEAEIVHGQPGFGQIGVEASRAAFTPEELREWELLGAGEVEAFVKAKHILSVHSSNVVAAQYLPDSNEMIVEFGAQVGGGRFYAYSNVTESEALSFAQAPSKGGWCWQVLRIKGTRNGHRKPFRPVNGFVQVQGRGYVS